MRNTLARFTPPYCPNTECPHHLDPTGWTPRKRGFFHREAAPHRIQRYRCTTCGRHFSSQTFSTTYWLKRPDIQQTIFNRVIRCSSLRQIASELEVAHSTVMTHVERLGRHCLLFHLSTWLGHLSDQPPDEPLVLDGFESFEYSQYHPFHFNLVVGARTHFTYAFTDSELRRKGRMTAWQKKRRAELEAKVGTPDPKSIEKASTNVLTLLLPPGSRALLHSDDHPAYRRALKRLSDREVVHLVTSSKERRTTRNPLFPVNLMDLLIRHYSANHKRETIAWSKRRQAAVERLWVLVAWRNYVKSFSEKTKDPSPAMRMGLTTRKLTVREVLGQRLQPTRVGLPEVFEGHYRRELRTRALENERRHELKYAY